MTSFEEAVSLVSCQQPGYASESSRGSQTGIPSGSVERIWEIDLGIGEIGAKQSHFISNVFLENILAFLITEKYAEGSSEFGQIAERLESESAHEAFGGYVCSDVAILPGVQLFAFGFQ
jgi:hypothetical protein